MKKILLVLTLIGALGLCGCAYRLERPADTDLEFWITEEMDGWDLEGYEERGGLFGGREYYGSGYAPTYDEDGQRTEPEHYVLYTITAYPDHSSRTDAITRITVTDPEVRLYGLTFRSDREEIQKVMAEEGYKQGEGLTFTKGNVTVWFTDTSMGLRADVTNRFGIVF